MKPFSKKYATPGTDPGSLFDASDADATAPVRLHIIEYDQVHFEEIVDASVDQCIHQLDTPTNTWIHVHGKANGDVLRQLGGQFHLHPLALEDVINTGQRAKSDSYENQLFLVLHTPYFRGSKISTSQFSFFLGKDFVVSFDDGHPDVFETVRAKLRNPNSRARGLGADYLLYLLMDLVVDNGYPVLESYGENIEILEAELLNSPDKSTLNQIHVLKRELLLLRRTLWPQRDAIGSLIHNDQQLFRDNTRLYLRDCYDHCIQIMDLLETYREMSSGMLDVYLSSFSLRLNEIMRMLAVFSAVFLPMTFVAGIYGMNFHPVSKWNMPELDWIYGYPFALGLMAIIGLGLLWFFNRKKWL